MHDTLDFASICGFGCHLFIYCSCSYFPDFTGHVSFEITLVLNLDLIIICLFYVILNVANSRNVLM